MSYACLENKIVKARKQHRCYLCDLPIVKGIKYIRRACVEDGDFFTAKMHQQCEMTTKAWDLGDWEAHDSYEFREYLAPEILAEVKAEQTPQVPTDFSK